MRSFVTQPVSRLMMVLAAAAVMSGTASAQAQTAPPPAQPAAAAPAAPDVFKFTTPAAIVLNSIKPEKAADFEAVWTEIKAGLAASAKPELQQQAAALKLFKLSVDLPADQPRIYVFYIDPVPAVTFEPTKILFESGAFERPKADELYAKLKDCYTNLQPWPLTKFGG